MTLHRMTSILPADLPTPTLTPAGLGDGAAAGETTAHAVLPIHTLEVPVEWMRFCPHCGSQQRFVAGWFSFAGLIAECVRCGDTVVAEYTRVNSEGA